MPVILTEARPGLRAVYSFGPSLGRSSSRGSVPPGHQLRTCANCGAQSLFRMDPEGTWAVCEACGKFA
jgi:hypothetical protein